MEPNNQWMNKRIEKITNSKNHLLEHGLIKSEVLIIKDKHFSWLRLNGAMFVVKKTVKESAEIENDEKKKKVNEMLEMHAI